jgi:peptidoglycan/xylan/chitin deacetylase (PgdA/CDA1 family)
MPRFRKYGRAIAGVMLVLLIGIGIYASYEVYLLGTISINLRPADAAATALPGHESRVAILRSEYTSKFFTSSTNYRAHIEYWRSLIQGSNLPSKVISDLQLEGGVTGYRILVLPSAICLSEKERAAIRDFVSKGGGIICTWATGARDEKGAWKGLDFVAALTGSDNLEFTEKVSPWYVSFASDNPLTAGAPSAARIQVDSPERLQAKNLHVDGYWSDARLFPVDLNLPVNFQGALVHNTIGQGRIAWFGFQENSAVAGGENKTILDSILKNALAWAGHRTLGAVNPWPAPYVAASVFACDVEDEYSNATFAANALRRSQEKGTFFCLTNMVKEDADLIPQLQGAGEVASHGDTHAGFGQIGMLSQVIRLAKSKWRIRRLGGSRVEGFHPPSDDFSDTTLKALVATRFHYVVIGDENSSGGGSVLPEIMRVSQNSHFFHRDVDLVRLTRTMEDDLHYSPLGMVGLDPSWISQRALSDFEIIRGLGGLYIFAFHSQGFSAPQYVGIIPKLVEQFHQNATWIATAGDVARWWELRSHLSLSIADTGTSGAQVTVKYSGSTALDNAVLSVYPSGHSVQGQIAPADKSQTQLQLIPSNDPDRITLKLGKLDPGVTYSFDVRWTQ